MNGSRSVRIGERAERLVLLFGIVTGIVLAVFAVSEFRSESELDFHAYYFAGQAIAQGDPFIGWAITDGTFLVDKAYVYTPVTGPLFVPYGLLPEWQMAYTLNAAVLFATLAAISYLCIRYIESQGRTLARVDRALIVGFCLVSTPAVLALYRGNIDPVILLLFVGGFFAIEQGREAEGGALWAVAALFKLFPAILGVWLLYRRAYRAIAAALIVGVGATLVGVAMFGIEVHLEFIEFILTERSRAGAFEGGLDPTSRWITLRRPLSQVLSLSGTALMFVGLGILLPFLYPMYRRADSSIDQLGVLTATLIALLVTVVPSTAGYVVYLLFSLVVLSYLVESYPAKGLLLAGLALIMVPLYPQYIKDGLELLPLSTAAVELGNDIALGVLTYTSVALVGFLLAFFGCVLFVCNVGDTDA